MNAEEAAAPLPVRFRVFAPRGLNGGRQDGGKQVSVFGDAAGDLQARAAGAGTPLSVFVEAAGLEGVRLRTFTPQREKGESDSASVAALSWLQSQGLLADFAEVQTGESRTSAQLCGGEWLLSQGAPRVSPCLLELPELSRRLGVHVVSAHLSSAGRPNLVLEVPDLAALDGYVPDAGAIVAVGEMARSTGLVLYTLAAPDEGPQRRADVSFRAFGPQRGFLEDAASSNMGACLVAVLGERGRWPEGSNVLRAAQRRPGQPALLTAQFSVPGEAVWVGGRAEALSTVGE